MSARPSFFRVLSPLTLLVLWQAASLSGLLPARILASPMTIAATGWELLRSGELLLGLAVSALRVIAGFALGLLLAMALALLAGLSRAGEAIVDPPVQMLKALPFLGLLPLLILWFGIGEAPKIILVAAGTLFPVYLTFHAGLRGVDPKLVEAGRMLGLSAAERIRHVLLPGALPSLLVGIRYGLSIAWLSLVVGEQVNARYGLGQIIANARDFLQTDVIIVCLIIYALMGLATDQAVRWVEARALAWRPKLAAA